MVNFMRKILVICFIFSAFLNFSSNVSAISKYINSNGIEMTEEEYNNLLSMAFTEEDIYLMTQDEFDNNRGKVGIKTVSTVSYVKTVAMAVPKSSSLNVMNLNSDNVEIIYRDYYLTEEQMEQELLNDSQMKYPGLLVPTSASSVVETSYKKLTASITTYMGSEGWMYYRSRADMEWLKMPKITSEDMIRVRVTDGFMSGRDKRYGKQIAVKNGNTETVTYKSDSSKWEDFDVKDYEEILKPNLINGPGVTERRIYMYFDAYQYYPDNYDYFRAEAAYNHYTLLNSWDGWIFTTAEISI